MPELVGMQEDHAIEILESVRISDPQIEELASLKPPGEVLKQLPSSGSSIRGPVTLTIAVPPPPMPDYTGERVGDARAELEAWGVSVVEESELNHDRPSGEVIGSTPKFGDEIGAEVVLRVAVAPVIGTLEENVPEVAWESFSSRDYDSIHINGNLYENSVYSSGWADPGDVAFVEYDLGRDWEILEAAAGLLDDSGSDQGGRFRVILDGSVIWEQDVEFGNTADISINVSDGLRLRLEAVSLEEGFVGLGWGNVRLLGIPGEAPVGDALSNDE
jgi:hypothetical protein